VLRERAVEGVQAAEAGLHGHVGAGEVRFHQELPGALEMAAGDFIEQRAVDRPEKAAFERAARDADGVAHVAHAQVPTGMLANEFQRVAHDEIFMGDHVRGQPLHHPHGMNADDAAG